MMHIYRCMSGDFKNAFSFIGFVSLDCKWKSFLDGVQMFLNRVYDVHHVLLAIERWKLGIRK